MRTPSEWKLCIPLSLLTFADYAHARLTVETWNACHGSNACASFRERQGRRPHRDRRQGVPMHGGHPAIRPPPCLSRYGERDAARLPLLFDAVPLRSIPQSHRERPAKLRFRGDRTAGAVGGVSLPTCRCLRRDVRPSSLVAASADSPPPSRSLERRYDLSS